MQIELASKYDIEFRYHEIGLVGGRGQLYNQRLNEEIEGYGCSTPQDFYLISPTLTHLNRLLRQHPFAS